MEMGSIGRETAMLDDGVPLSYVPSKPKKLRKSTMDK